MRALPDTTAPGGGWTAGSSPRPGKTGPRRLLQLVAQDPSFLEGPSLYSGHLALGHRIYPLLIQTAWLSVGLPSCR